MPILDYFKRLPNALQHRWNAFIGRDPTTEVKQRPGNYYGSYSVLPSRPTFSRGNERSFVNSVYNRIATDAAAAQLVHARVDQNGRYIESIKSHFNDCLSIEANVDQTGRELIQDIVISMIDEGVVAVVPTDTSDNPLRSTSYDILEMRTAKVLEWFPDSVRVRIYNEITGRKEDRVFPKKMVALIQNPFYSVMNQPNSTLKRLVRKMNLLDEIDERNGTGKLDMIIQLPYVIKTDARKQQAENRRKDIEDQLANSKYGIAYTDGTEKIQQLGRPLENNLQAQITSLKDELLTQLGITNEILNGTASEETMTNYYTRTIEPILSAISDEFKRKFLTKTARTQGQSIWYFRDPFKLVPVSKIADIADRFTRNEILSSNEVRGLIGFRPSDDPRADELRNKNINQSSEEIANEQPYNYDESYDENYDEDY